MKSPINRLDFLEKTISEKILKNLINKNQDKTDADICMFIGTADIDLIVDKLKVSKSIAYKLVSALISNNPEMIIKVNLEFVNNQIIGDEKMIDIIKSVESKRILENAIEATALKSDIEQIKTSKTKLTNSFNKLKSNYSQENENYVRLLNKIEAGKKQLKALQQERKKISDEIEESQLGIIEPTTVGDRLIFVVE